MCIGECSHAKDHAGRRNRLSTIRQLAGDRSFKTQIGATLLLVFLVAATYFFHDFWNFTGQEQQMQMIQFMKNLS